MTFVISNNKDGNVKGLHHLVYRDIGSMIRKLGFLEKNLFIWIQTNSETYFMNVQ